VVVVSDRLISAQGRYRQLRHDIYKHLSLITDDAEAIVLYSGFSGFYLNNQLKHNTIEWLTETIWNATEQGNYRIDDHIKYIINHANDHISEMERINPNEDLRLVIELCGYTVRGQFACWLSNCLDSKFRWKSKPSSSFKVMSRLYDKSSFKNIKGYCYFSGLEALGMKQVELRGDLEKAISNENAKEIFNASVEMIVAASRESGGAIGKYCSGIAIRKNKGAKCFDNREAFSGIQIMPNIIIAKSDKQTISSNLRLIFQSQNQS
jgi:hypothetical protein